MFSVINSNHDSPRPSRGDDAVLPGRARGQNELVLVADDEPLMRELTQEMLELFGYRVVTARNGAEAVAIYAAKLQHIALVLTDMMMPTMDGLATIHALREINPDVRIIGTSGLELPANIAKAVGTSVCDFLLKPYSAQTLVQHVRQMLDRSPDSPQGA